MECPKCHGDMKAGALEFEASWWFGSRSLRGRCYFWAEGMGRRELFALEQDPPAWYCTAGATVVVEKQSN